jgi:hypothetical protein
VLRNTNSEEEFYLLQTNNSIQNGIARSMSHRDNIRVKNEYIGNQSING